jgi:hypothetical protein
MRLDDIMDSMSHEFLLVRMKRELDGVQSPEQLRQACLQLIDLVERQKSMFKQLLYTLIEDNPEAQELFE